MVDDGRSSVFPWSVGLFRLFSCLFVRMSVWCMASICMSLVVCWLFLKWYVDSREVLCFTSISFSRVWRLPSVWPRYCSTAPTYMCSCI